MNRSTVLRVTAGVAVALFAAASAAAVTPKAKYASNSVEVDPPERLIAYFESNDVDLSEFRANGTLDEATAQSVYDLYTAKDGFGDLIHSGQINSIALGALSQRYNEVSAPVYMELGPLYWGNWRDKDGLSD